MADSIDVNENFEANEDELAILPTSVAQGYLYEPRVQQSEPLSDDYSDDESDGESDNGEIPVESERVGNTDWCTCGHCVPQETDEMSTCCHEIIPIKHLVDDLKLRCIIQHPGYEGNCLNPYVVETSFYEFLDYYGHIGDEEAIEEKYRHVAYRRFTRWVWHRLGKGVRRVIPSCAYEKIKQQWPSQEYTGFKYRRDY